MPVTTTRLRALVSALIVVSAALFAVGVAIERHEKKHALADTHATTPILLAAAPSASPAHRAAESPSHRAAETPAHRAGETPAHRAGETPAHRAGESAAHRAAEVHGERVFGIDIESTGLVVAAVAVSLVLAIALWLSGSALIPLGVAGFALVAAIFDVREVFHQIDESRTNLTVIAAIVAALHLVVVAGALVLVRRSTDPRSRLLGGAQSGSSGTDRP
jgi:hypothetical protein